jgi:hypothetical protein
MNNQDSDNNTSENKKRRLDLEIAIDKMDRDMNRKKILEDLKLVMYLSIFQAQFNKMSLDIKKITLQYIIDYIETFDDHYKNQKNEIIRIITSYKVSYENNNISNINWSFLSDYFDIYHIGDLLYIMKDLKNN